MAIEGHFIPASGGVTAAAGFLAGVACCSVKPENLKKPDLALLCSEVPTVGAAVFTTNKIKAAPVKVSAAHLRTADLRAVVLNSGNANACTGLEGIENAKRMAYAPWAGALVCASGRCSSARPGASACRSPSSGSRKAWRRRPRRSEPATARPRPAPS